jgi:hypothetical protein
MSCCSEGDEGGWVSARHVCDCADQDGAGGRGGVVAWWLFRECRVCLPCLCMLTARTCPWSACGGSADVWDVG